MNRKQMAYFKDLIDRELDELAQESKAQLQGQSIVELDQQAVGRLSRMDALQSQAMAKAAAQRRGQRVLRLKGALVRIDEGEYGYCADCGDEIGFERLSVDPSLVLCRSCMSG